MVIIYTDGASRGNPGQAAIGVVITDARGTVIETVSRAIGVTTNNQAEYRAVIAGLERALLLEPDKAVLRTDSQLVARQMTGVYRIKNKDLKPLCIKAMKLASGFDEFAVEYISRNRNRKADELANLALDNEK